MANVLEGTVQRSGNRVRVNAQLVDSRTSRQLWGETYDRDLADVFAIQSEIAEQIVSQLKSKLSPQEKAAIEEKSTSDLIAHDLYIQAKTLVATAIFSTPLRESLVEAVRLLNQAVERDPAFALAYYQLAQAHDQLYFSGSDHTPARLEMADAAIRSLTRLRPDSGEAHLALAKHLYWGYLDYAQARQELEMAQKSLPNEPWVFLLTGYIDRRQGRWAESTKNLERAIDLDPQNRFFLQQLANSYLCLRQYADAESVLDRAIKLDPKDSNMLDDVTQISGVARELVIPREAMGRGDLKFLAAIGAFLGWRAVLFSLFAGSLLGSIVGLITLVVGKRVWSAKLPFGPYLAFGALSWMFFGQVFLNWYARLLSP